MSIKDPKSLLELSDKFNGIADAKKTFDYRDDELAYLCKKHGGLDLEGYQKALQDRETDPYALDDFLKGSMGRFKKLFMSQEAFAEKVNELDQRVEIKKTIAELDEKFAELGNSMSGLLFKDPQTRKILFANLRAENGKIPPSDTSFSNAREVLKKGVTQEQIKQEQGRWEAIKKAHAKDPDFDIDRAHSDFIKESGGRMAPKGPGLMSRLLKFLLTGKLEKAIVK